MALANGLDTLRLLTKTELVNRNKLLDKLEILIPTGKGSPDCPPSAILPSTPTHPRKQPTVSVLVNSSVLRDTVQDLLHIPGKCRSSRIIRSIQQITRQKEITREPPTRIGWKTECINTTMGISP